MENFFKSWYGIIIITFVITILGNIVTSFITKIKKIKITKSSVLVLTKIEKFFTWYFYPYMLLISEYLFIKGVIKETNSPIDTSLTTHSYWTLSDYFFSQNMFPTILVFIASLISSIILLIYLR